MYQSNTQCVDKIRSLSIRGSLRRIDGLFDFEAAALLQLCHQRMQLRGLHPQQPGSIDQKGCVLWVNLERFRPVPAGRGSARGKQLCQTSPAEVAGQRGQRGCSQPARCNAIACPMCQCSSMPRTPHTPHRCRPHSPMPGALLSQS